MGNFSGMTPQNFCFSGTDNYVFQGNLSNYDTNTKSGILYGSPFRKITRATQNFNMAANSWDDRHGLSWNPIFAFKLQQMVKKDNFDNKLCVFEHVKGPVNVAQELFKFLDRFNIADNFQDGRHRLSFLHYYFALNWSRWFKIWFGVICDMFQRVESK